MRKQLGFPEPLAKNNIIVFNFIPALYSNPQMVYCLCVGTVKTQYCEVLWEKKTINGATLLLPSKHKVFI